MSISSHKIIKFQKLIADLPDRPTSTLTPALLTPQELREYFDSSPEELRQALNALIDDLLSLISSDKGAIASINNVSNAAGNIDLVGGTGILISPDDVNNRITLTATGEMIPGAHAYTHAIGGIDELTPNDIGAATTAIYTATLDTTWDSSTAPYTKTVTVTGMLATDTPIVDVVMSGTYATDEARIEAWGYIYRITTADNSITLYATEKPAIELPIQIKVVR